MPELEIGVAVVRGRIRENLRIPFPVDAYYDVAFIPGFSDTHAHPQVVDAGLVPGRVWSNSYEWLLLRDIRVDEAAIRSDIGLSSRLAELALRRALLEGTTLIAFTGRLEANLKAFTRLEDRPRLVVLPTVMRKRGWYRPEDVERGLDKYRKYIGDSLLRTGLFVHSIAYGGPDFVAESLELAKRIRGPLGMHLSEGVSERREFLEYTCCLRDNVRIIAVHCLDDDYSDLGLRCSSCPASNIILYERYLEDLDRATSFGSDWPHLVGTVGAHLPLLRALYSGMERVYLYKATVGGYYDYGVSYEGDLVAYDGSLRSVLEGESRPRLVSVAGRVAVEEGRLASTGETLDDVVRETWEVISYAMDVYGDGSRPYVPRMDELVENARRLAAFRGGRVAPRRVRGIGQRL